MSFKKTFVLFNIKTKNVGNSLENTPSTEDVFESGYAHKFMVSPATWFFSPWLRRFVNSFVVSGHKATAGKIVREAFVTLKKSGVAQPLIFMFETFEMLRMPIRAYPFKHGRSVRMISRRLPWWQQFTGLMQWFRTATVSRTAKTNFASVRLAHELVVLSEAPNKSKVYQRRLQAYQNVVEGRQLTRYRWSAKRTTSMNTKIFKNSELAARFTNANARKARFAKLISSVYAVSSKFL